jgi:cell wall-associated NlpC family hydrolase
MMQPGRFMRGVIGSALACTLLAMTACSKNTDGLSSQASGTMSSGLTGNGSGGGPQATALDKGTSGTSSAATAPVTPGGAEAAPAPSRPLAAIPTLASRPAPPIRPAGPSESEIRSKAASWKGVPFRDDGKTRKGIGNPELVRAIVKDAFNVDVPGEIDDQMRTGKLVERKDLQAGDLVFFEGKGFGPFKSRSVGLFIGRGEVVLAKKDVGVTTVRLSDEPWSSSYKTARRASVPPTADAPSFDVASYGGKRDALLRDVAKAWVGTLYRQGGTTFEGIGNDEFVRSIYEAINDDDLAGKPQQWATMGHDVKRANLQPGDIILYEAIGIGSLLDRRHAGMYIGNGEFVHAMKGSAVTISKMDDPRWSKAFRAARRIDPDTSDVGVRNKPAVRTASGALPASSSTVGRTVSDPERRLREAADPWMGTPYKLGGESKSGVDCSAFVRALYNDVYGVQLPRTAEEQETLGAKVDRKELQSGDLVFFRTKGMGPFFKSRHVGVYLGGGEFAQASGRLGVNITPLSNRYWSKKYEGARRLKPVNAN